MPVRVENELLGTIRQHAKWFANGAATKKNVSDRISYRGWGMNFSYHYQTAHLEEHDMELLYYYMMRILFKGNCSAGYEHWRDYGTGIKRNRFQKA